MDGQQRQRSGDDSHRAHLNGEGKQMETELRPEVEAHLAEDASSPEELRDLRATAALLGALPQVAPRRTFILTPEQVAASGGRRAARRLGWVWPTRWATAVAAVCFAVTIGLGQGGAAEPAAVTPSPAAAVASTATSQPAGVGPTQGTVEPTLQIFGVGTAIVVPAPTAVAVVPPPPVAAPMERIDWRPAQLALGALTAIGAFFGFLLPPFLRRRGMATA
jgi:hypothetical protein